MKRTVWLVLIFGITLISCNVEEGPCPTIWDLDLRSLTANATALDNQLLLTVNNPEGPNVIEMIQGAAEGDFIFSVQVDGMEWDSLVAPQFRLEVVSEDQTFTSGVALNHNAFYTYADVNDFADMRLVSTHIGVMELIRVGDTITSAGYFGNVNWQVSEVVHGQPVFLRMVFGAAEAGSGNISVTLDDFIVGPDSEATIDPNAPIKTDLFECASW